MLILLPPSETKTGGGAGRPLDLAELSLPDLTDTRVRIAEALVEVSADDTAGRAALGLSAAQADELERNRTLWSAPTRVALERYTGVLYEALDVAGFTRAQRAKADARLAIGSALFGVVRAADPIPAYRLSAGSKLPGLRTLAAEWKPDLADALDALDCGLVVDLRSGGYAALGRVEGAVTATVVTEREDGSRSVVSHFNKHHKGLLARALVATRAEPADARAVVRVAQKAGLRAEVTGSQEVTIVTSG
ncbi:peroxide stress protein YaaA [Tsukamurella sp. 8F]|uniref:peroxide stress protein YaaA n=1 Tax=unclassified Tsukamurella TaxID=2633480 RepID=UPI0023B90E67|nr:MULTISPECIES: peroxide stress protein YaaA [unclassified Tsukamurella]MDF0531608.1 peroxide stress protein YaaA [Tsukamurella sp. 8J]MDF0587545.1 peroxide stress protein YaaA [Tsukamurella sp. 8F]